MTRLRAVLAANALLGIVAFFLIATDWRAEDASDRYGNPVLIANANAYRPAPLTRRALPKLLFDGDGQGAWLVDVEAGLNGHVRGQTPAMSRSAGTSIPQRASAWASLAGTA